jgi:Tol biopolymer transport system component
MTRLTDSGKVGVAAISGDGRFIAYSLREPNHSLWVQQIAPESKVRILPPSPDAIQGVTFSPDGSSVYFVRANKGYVIPTLGRTPRLLIESSFSGIGVSPDGTKTGIRPRCMRFNSPSAPAWSPDGKRIAMLGMRKTDNILSLYPVAGGAPTIIPLQYTVSDPKWLPDQSGLILTIGDLSSGRWKIGPSRQIWIRPFPTGNAQRLTNDLDTYSSTSVTNDSALIAAVQIQSVEPIKPLN